MPDDRGTVRQVVTGLVCLCLAAAVWLPCIHLLFRQDVDEYFCGEGIPPKAQALVARQLELWTDPGEKEKELERMRQSNAEWDFMSRTFFVLSLANMSLRNHAKQDLYLDVMDHIIDVTIQQEQEHGVYYFLMPYARNREWIAPQQRSIFEDGEIALMLAVRRLVEEKNEYEPELTERVNTMVAMMESSPVLCAESYPDECWIFCNAVALDAIRIADILDGTDHSAFLSRWLETAKRTLTHRETGMLYSSFSVDGTPLDGPEGSSIWFVSHCLQIIDPEFAADQYARAKRELADELMGFAYAGEWPDSWRGAADIDSGPIIPVLDMSAGSSGMAFLGAGAFKDKDYLSGLLASLTCGGFPIERDGRLRYAASNQVGDAVLLYSMVLGPLWEEVGRRAVLQGREGV
ncbi:hypothetical protein ACFLSJ_06135 [Verrucomicrobiota bacterium]